MGEKFELLYGNTNKVLKINAERGESYVVEEGAINEKQIALGRNIHSGF